MHTLDDIIPPSRRKDTTGVPLSNKSSNREPSNKSHFPFVTLGVILLIIAVSIAALFYFSSAKVIVTPKTVSAEVQSSLTATQSTGSLPFEIITAQKTASQNVVSSGSKVVDSYASGTITIYNTQAQTQRLIANTRFATTAGLIFRIHSAVSVPGGSSAKPGSITTKVFADKTGDSYNVAPTSFTLPGLAGTPQASQVYARSSVAMTGGSSGSVPIIDSAVETKARKELITALGPDLEVSIQSQIPSGYVLVPGSSITTYQELASIPSSTTGQVDVKEQGTITAVVFPNVALAKSIASSIQVPEYNNEPLTLASVNGLSINMDNEEFDSNVQSLTFSISGTASLIYTIDKTRIAAAVAGETRSSARVALSNYLEVKNAAIILRPIWKQTFPQDPSSISVVVNDPLD